MRLAALLLEVSFEVSKLTMPVVITLGCETKVGATKFYADVGERDE